MENRPKHNYILIILAAFLLAVFAMLCMVGIAAFNYLSSLPRPSPAPAPVAAPREETPPAPAPASPLTSDAEIRLLQDELNTLQKNLDALDLFEPQLAPPNLDLSIQIIPAD